MAHKSNIPTLEDAECELAWFEQSEERLYQMADESTERVKLIALQTEAEISLIDKIKLKLKGQKNESNI